MLVKNLVAAHEASPPADVVSAVQAVTPARPKLFGLENTTMGAPAPDKHGTGYLVRGLFNKTGVSILGAEEGTGKSLISCSLAAIVAVDRANKGWCDFEVLITGRSLLVLAEGLETMHKARFEASLRNTFGMDPAGEEYATAMDRVDVFSERTRLLDVKASNPGTELGRRLFYVPTGSNSREYVPTPMLQEIISHIRASNEWADKYGTPQDRIVLLVLDTLQALFGVNLIDDEAINDVMQFLNITMDDLGVACIVTAHTNKSSKAEDDDPRGSIKGSQQILAAVESVALLRHMTMAEYEASQKAGLDIPDNKAFALKPGKQNSRDADRYTKLLMGLPDGAPIGITERVGGSPGGSGKRGGYTAEQIEDAVLQLFEDVWSRGETRITANSLYKLTRVEEEQSRRPALKFVTAEPSQGSKKSVKVSDVLRKAEGRGKMRGVQNGRGRFYQPMRG